MEQRSARRVVPGEPLLARLRPGVKARVLDLSPRGLQVEVAAPLPLRSTVEVRFQTDHGEVEVRAVVRRCRVQGRAAGGPSEGALLYRAGLELLRPAPALLSALGVQAARLGGGDLRIRDGKGTDVF